MPPVGFEPTISAGERPQTYALDRAATWTGATFDIAPRIAVNKQWRYTGVCLLFVACTKLGHNLVRYSSMSGRLPDLFVTAQYMSLVWSQNNFKSTVDSSMLKPHSEQGIAGHGSVCLLVRES